MDGIPVLPPLSLLETRVLGVLVEKQRTVPDSYPMTLNALLAGCNQKTSRDPVLEADEAELAAAVERLRELKLVTQVSGGRAMRYQHQAGLVLHLPTQSIAILAVLMLRGPQTAGELRINCERLHRFADISAVEAFLNELAERPAGAFVMQLPRQSGARESRWVHLLSGEPDPRAFASTENTRGAEADSLAHRVGVLETELASLREELLSLKRELGLQADGA